MSDWTEKYRPQSLDDVKGNTKAIKKLRKWAQNWEDDKEAIILYGVPGVGKTSSAHALASDMGWEVVEMNASDKRTKSLVNKIAGESSKSGTISGGVEGKRLVIIDEADNISGTADRGGSRAITDVVKNSSQPIVLVANDYYDMSRGLRSACEEIEFEELNDKEIAKALRDICREENVKFEIDALNKLAEQANGDLRSAINDLQSAATGNDKITTDSITTGKRDKKSEIFPYLDKLLKTGTPKDVYEEARDLDENPNDLFRWVDENIGKVYEGEELAEGMKHLSNADIWLGRVNETQEYSYWKNASSEMTAGVASARKSTKGGWTRFSPPQWRSINNTKQEIAQKIGKKNGVSSTTAMTEIMPYLSVMTHHCKNRDLTVKMAAYYDMDEKEISHITGSGETTNKVQSIVEDAEELKEKAGVQEIEEENIFKNINEEDIEEKEDSEEKSEDSNSEKEQESDDGDDDDDTEQKGLGDFM